MNYTYGASEQFWRAFHKLPNAQKESVRQAWKIFKEDPFDARLRVHKINRLSAQYDRTVYAAVIEGDLRVAFYLEGSEVFTVDVGTHDIYKG